MLHIKVKCEDAAPLGSMNVTSQQLRRGLEAVLLVEAVLLMEAVLWLEAVLLVEAVLWVGAVLWVEVS